MQIHQQIKQLTTSWLFSSVFPQFVQFARGELVFAEAWGGMGWHGGRNLLQLGNVSAEKKSFITDEMQVCTCCRRDIHSPGLNSKVAMQFTCFYEFLL